MKRGSRAQAAWWRPRSQLATIASAHLELPVTACPAPGITTTLLRGNLAATCRAPAVGVRMSRLPERIRPECSGTARPGARSRRLPAASPRIPARLPRAPPSFRRARWRPAEASRAPSRGRAARVLTALAGSQKNRPSLHWVATFTARSIPSAPAPNAWSSRATSRSSGAGSPPRAASTSAGSWTASPGSRSVSRPSSIRAYPSSLTRVGRLARTRNLGDDRGCGELVRELHEVRAGRPREAPAAHPAELVEPSRKALEHPAVVGIRPRRRDHRIEHEALHVRRVAERIAERLLGAVGDSEERDRVGTERLADRIHVESVRAGRVERSPRPEAAAASAHDRRRFRRARGDDRGEPGADETPGAACSAVVVDNEGVPGKSARQNEASPLRSKASTEA